MNLAVNARDAMPNGGKLTIKTANVRFDDVTSFYGVAVPPGDYVTLSVTDTGTGMDAETQKRLFEPFFTTKAAGKGTGLGLATVYGIVKQSAGYIFADSELRKGTTFKVYIPRVELRVEEVSSSAKIEGFLPGSETLLVVEDERSFRDVLCDGLKAKGYQVLVASNGVDALKVAERHSGRIDLLITDVIMPQMSGPELARGLIDLRGSLDVLYMSGYADDKLRAVPGSNSELTWIQKPFYLDDLLQKIKQILQRKNTPASQAVAPTSTTGAN